MRADALNGKETKEITKWLEQNFEADLNLDYYFFKNEGGKVYIVNKELSDIDLTKLRIDSLGLYFCTEMDDGYRLSIEGSQIIGKYAKKNVLAIDDEEMIRWLKGEDLTANDINGYYIVKHNKDFVGCCKIKDGRVLNYVPKARRVKTVA